MNACRKYLFVTFLLVLAARAFPAVLEIGLYHEHMVRSVLFTPVEGLYSIRANGMMTQSAGPGSAWYFLYRDDTIYFRSAGGEWFSSGEIIIEGEEGGVFSLKPADPLLDSRDYYGDLLIGVSMKSLLMLNRIDMETYIMGVNEAEAGPACRLEYYKVQAVLCRTFALKNIDRHEEEGFQLCDGVHCQVYKGRHIWNEDVEIGTEVTSGLVICDADSSLINPVYHSNSGGETQSAEKVWLRQESYLQPVLDPFSKGQPNASWERSMNLDDWLMYLLSYGIVFPGDADTSALAMIMTHRRLYYRVLGDSIPVENIRRDFSYRSSFFDVIPDGRMIRIRGRGYGHGVGLSQEGAMEMARRRYHYAAILNYYYYGIRIIPRHFLGENQKIH